MQNTRPNRRRPFLFCINFAVLLLSLASCLDITPSFPESTFSSKHYHVGGAVSVGELEAVGALMDGAFVRYSDITGTAPPAGDRFRIRLYHRRGKYEKHAKLHGFRYGSTAGFFAPDRQNAIHVIGNPVTSRTVTGTLVHEGFHQFAYHTLYFRIPPHLKKDVPVEQHVMMSLPLWLNEGIATVLESVSFEKHRLVVAPVNRRRLKQLKKMLKKKNAPSVRSALSLPAGCGLTSREYAVFWGVTYDIFFRDGIVPGRRLSGYLSQCRSAFYHNPKDYHAGIEMVDWHRRIARKGLEALLEMIVKPGESLEDWEKEWQKRMMAVRVVSGQ